MSAMLDTYDMQMLDYSADHDIQMHQSSSDQWFPDESKMEEDGPTLFKDDNDIHLKADAYNEEKVDITIEVDMEPLLDSHNPEYDMLDDEDIQGTEILDVEVYDASHAQSPAMFAADTAQEDSFFPSFETTDLGSANGTLPIEPNHSQLDAHFPALGSSEAAPILETPAESSHVEAASESEHTAEAVTAVELPEPVAEVSGDSVELDAHTEHHELGASNSAPEHVEHDEKELGNEVASARSAPQILELTHEPEVGKLPTQVSPSDADTPAPVESYDQTDNNVVTAQSSSSGDPHEISDGVYIDPPPPVMLSMGSDEQFDFSLFSEPSTWGEIFSKESDKQTHVLLSAFPTLYYETLPAVFDALRQEESVKAMLSTTIDSELVLEAVDLQLIMTEDNMYAQNIALHDLNVLHDVSGINGFLRVRLYATAPRFVTRYQRLQDEVSRLNEEHVSEDPPVDSHLEDISSQQQQNHETSTTQTDSGESEVAYEETTQAPLEEVESLAQEDNHSSQHNDEDAQTEQEPITTTESAIEQPISDAGPSVESNEFETTEVVSHSSSHVTNLDHCGEATTDDSTGSGLLDNATHPDHNDEGDIAALETTEANFDDDVANGDTSTSHSFDGDEYADGDYNDAEYEEDQERPEEYQEQSADYQDEPTDYQGQDQSAEYQDQSSEYQDQSAEYQDQSAEYQEQEQEYQDEQQHTTNGEDNDATEDQEALVHPKLHRTQEHTNSKDVDSLTSAVDVKQDVQSSDPQQSENQSNHEQISVVNDEANSEGFAGDHNTHVDTSYDEIAYTDSLQEFSSNDETGDFAQTTEDQLHPHEYNIEDQDKSLEDNFDGEEDADATWDDDNENLSQSKSNNSSVTLSSKASKRGFDEIDSNGEEDADEVSQHWTPPGSPGPKRSRIH